MPQRPALQEFVPATVSSVPRSANEMERLRALHDLSILDTPPDPVFDRLSSLAASTFGTSMAAVSFIDADRQWLKSRVGIDVAETSRDTAFCAHTILSDAPLVVLDATTDIRFVDNPFVVGNNPIRFYAGVSITDSAGLNLGTFCVVDTKPRAEFTSREEAQLRTFAQLAWDAIEAHKRQLSLKTSAAEARDRYDLVARATLDGMWDWDITRNTVYYSPRWQYIVGLPEKDHHSSLIHWLDRVHPEDRPTVDAELQRHIDGVSSRFRNEHRVRHGDNSWRWVVVRGLAHRLGDGTCVRMAGSLMDITKDRTSDPLTGLPNRVSLHERLSYLIRRGAETQRWHFAVMFLDVDRFKHINDRHGHLTGDAMLKAVAHRLQHLIEELRPGSESMVARFAGDEFVILLDDVQDSMEAQEIATKIKALFETPLSCSEDTIQATLSIGIAMARPELITPERFLQNSDLAMYRAKVLGHGLSVLFDPSMQKETTVRLELEAGLRKETLREQLEARYQPQVDFHTGQLIGCEALIRWRHPRRGLLSPADFIGLAEEIGAVGLIDRWVLETACEQLAIWRKNFAANALKISVNVSAQHLGDGSLKRAVQSCLQRFELPASALCLEVTESVLISDSTGGLSAMQELRAMGVELHMDDFGSGYSSFRQLCELPFDVLKIDRSFLQKIPEDEQATTVVEGIIGLAHTMKLKVIAEGVETQRQSDVLCAAGCDYGQGYLYDRPLDTPAFEAKYLGVRTTPDLAECEIGQPT